MTLGSVIFLIQVLWYGIGKSEPCVPGFDSDLYVFGVPSEHLQRDTRIGTIVFNDCSGRTHIDFMSTDTQYHIDSDGTVKLQRSVTLHNGHSMFSLHAWDSRGKKHTALVRVEHQDQAIHHHGKQEDVDTIPSALTESSSVLPVLQFSKTSAGLQRKKRQWVIPPIKIEENHRGPYPYQIAQIKSSLAKETTMVYRISGEGADQPPVGLFMIDKYTGALKVSRPLDREAKDKYELQAFARSQTDNTVEPQMEVIVQVTDQNDNHPVFTQNPFLGSVPEASKIGFEFLAILATDADDPNTDNADIRYSIIKQTPLEPSSNLFAINPITGVLRVNCIGLDKEKYPEYILDIGVADMQGQGHPVLGKAIITVTDSNDKSLTKLKWVIPPIQVSENEQGHFPKQIGKIKFTHATKNHAKYSISGIGADLPPQGLFLIDKNTGTLAVSRPLDRETKDKYLLQAHVFLSSDVHYDPVELIIHVVDQNDNKPVFTQEPFIGSVSDAAKIGFEFMTISATDADDHNTDNADIRYSIISQTPPEPHPNMFEINPISGVIQVNAEGLDSVKYNKYVLGIQAADLQGNGFASSGIAVIFVTGSKDKNLTPSLEIWEISPICVTENSRGPFPKQLAKIFKSNHAKQTKIEYSITGEGADKPPVGLFTLDKVNGWLSVTKPLDREIKHEYVLQAHAIGDGINEHPTEISICVIDQNDNKPIFTQDPFLGIVPEASKIGFEFLNISATDADDPKTGNADIRYSITSQTPSEPIPNLFAINPITGVIQVISTGLDREKYPEYTLEILATDMKGKGLQTRGKAIITVAA